MLGSESHDSHKLQPGPGPDEVKAYFFLTWMPRVICNPGEWSTVTK